MIAPVQFVKGHWQLIVMTALVFLLWDTLLVFPLKMLVIFMHELSHGLAAIMTGGSIDSLSLSVREGGLAYTRGGNGFLISSSGYLGSLLIGMMLLIMALRTQADRVVLGICGGVTLAVAALYVRDGFALAFCSLSGAGMLAIAWYLSHPVNDMMLRIIGLTSMVYVPYDIFTDTIARPGIRSDARNIAENFGGTTMFWGGLWLVLSLAAIFLCLRYAIGSGSNLDFRKIRT